MFTYTAYRLGIHSNIEIPEFIASKAQRDVTIHVERGADASQSPRPLSPHIELSSQEAILRIEAVGEFWVRDGNQIVAHPNPGVSERILRQFLVGNLMAILLFQRGFLVLHASAMRVRDRAVAFLGTSGSGKSSIAATLHSRGLQVLSDDVTAVRMTDIGPEVVPGFPRIKIAPELVTDLGYDPASLYQISPLEENLGYQVGAGFSDRAYPLAQIYVLADGGEARLATLPAQDAMLELIRHSLPTRLGLPGSAQHFGQCAALVNQAQFFIFQRPIRQFPITEVYQTLNETLEMLQGESSVDSQSAQAPS